MQFSQLVYLAEIIKHGNISAAAKDLFISQSALSQSINNLENELGTALIRRSRYGIKPTYFGSRLCRDAGPVVESFRALEKNWASLPERGKSIFGKVNIMCTPGSADFLSGPVLDELHDAYPNIDLILKQSPELRYGFDTFLDSDVNIGLGSVVKPELEEYKERAEAFGFHFEALCEEEPMVLLGAKNRLSEKEALSREDLMQLDVVCFSEADSPGYLSLFRETVSRLPNKESIVKYVAGSNAAAVFSPSTIRKECAARKNSVKLLPLDFSAPDVILPVFHYLVYKQEKALSEAECCALEVIHFNAY